ncbi:MAG: thioredoxin domain-containing protein [Candidatus Heimdallarchaeota archaeon]|nr:thioredoxin domain-containing protein [Candidatus Heimdallarchaeota archaeon]MBY8994756.1 thioredoxin domain-containing protein [Candidatus Heimdallarchaeota archaeon]
MSKEASEKNKPKYNRLIKEKSPYLLQHATNPVDWYPWGKEAFEKAKKEDKPIFLSIGYSTCHWCHVMAHESFEDPVVAKLMNDTFVNIKVDREERPEIDNIYMTVCQMITGSGGWPLTIIMDAEKKPFTAGTYFPKESRFGRIGMLELIPKIKNYWDNNRDELQMAAKEVISQLQSIETIPGEELKQDMLDEAYREATLLFDEKNGGFRGAPKFPTPHKLMFLLRYWKRTGNKGALMMVEKTLTAMRSGGMYDHIGFGFHRYSTDSEWLLPHFEKMLYDQALLVIAYVEAYQATKKDEFRVVAEEILSYVLRDMTSQEGGFYSAEDADSEGEEGTFYIWTNDDILKVLGKEDGNLFLQVYNFEKEGNFKDQATQKKTGSNIPHLRKSITDLASELKISTKELSEKLEVMRAKLFENRETRIHPHKDDKILTDWNGLMIAAFSIAGRTFGNEEYITASEKALDFIIKNLETDSGRLMHRFREGEVAIKGMIDDYAFLIWALLELYQTTFKAVYLKKAIQYNDILIEHFWDEDKGAFFFTPNDGEELLVRKKEIYDGAIPSGNSVAMLNMLRISRITMDLTLEEKAVQMNKLFSTTIEQSLLAFTLFLSALEYAFGPSFEVVIVGKYNANDTSEMLKAVSSEYVPNKVVLFVPSDEENPEIYNITDFVKYKSAKNDKATAYVCINRFCKFPTNEIGKMLELLNPK